MKRKIAVAVGGLLSIFALAVFYSTRASADRPTWVTALVERGDVVAVVQASGTLEAVSTVQVGSQVSGNIMELYADYNSTVRKGQTVARLDPSLFESRLQIARANLAGAEANVEKARVAVEDARLKLERAEKLAAKSFLPQSDLDVARLNLQSAMAQLQSTQAQAKQAVAAVSEAEINLEHTIIDSPVGGVVISRSVDVGQTVAASLQTPTLFVIAEDLSKMRVVASVDEADIGPIAPGQPASFRVDAYPEDIFSGTVSQVRLNPIEAQNVVTYEVLVAVDNSDLELRPGMTAEVTIEVDRHSDVLRVPNAALRFRPTGSDSLQEKEGDQVWVLGPNGGIRPVNVVTGLYDEAVTEIEATGIEEGDRVVTGTSKAATTSSSHGLMSFLSPGRRPR
jgi:HlyD family secretion protein